MLGRDFLLVLAGLAFVGVVVLALRAVEFEPPLPTTGDDTNASAQLAAEVEQLAREFEAERAQPAPTARPSTRPGTAPSPGADSAQLQQLKERTATLRQLQPLADVETRLLDEDQLMALILELFERDYLSHEREADQRLLVALGLLREDQDVVEEWLKLYEDYVIGLYDDIERTLYVLSSSGQLGPEEQVTLVHEYVHALQDQHFDLARLVPRSPDNQDEATAAAALVEGDATLAMALYTLRHMTEEERAAFASSAVSGRLDEAPLVLQHQLLFPYTYGFRLAQRLYEQGGFAAIDRAFADPPRSTSQLLHPKKYDAREAPVEVTLPRVAATAGAGWQELATNTMGELLLRVLIEEFSDPSTAQSAASGWAGDRWQLLTRGPETILALRTVWESDRDAEEFQQVYAQGLQHRFGPDAVVNWSDTRLTVDGASHWLSVTLNERTVDVVVAPGAEIGTPVADALSQH